MTAHNIAKLPLFEGLSDEALERLAVLATSVTYTQGDYLFKEGALATRLYILLEGKIHIQVALSSRPENIVVASLGQPGQIVGWSGSMQTNYSASALCVENCRLLAFDGAAFQVILEDDCVTGFLITKRISDTISERLRNIQRVVLKTL